MRTNILILLFISFYFSVKGQQDYFIISVYKNCNKIIPKNIILTDSVGRMINFYQKKDTIFLQTNKDLIKGNIKVFIDRKKIIEWHNFILCDSLLIIGWLDKKSRNTFKKLDLDGEITSLCGSVLDKKDWAKIKRAYYISSCGRLWIKEVLR